MRNSHLTMQQAQERHDNALPPEDGPEPTDEQIETAFGRLVHNDAVLADFLDDWAPDTTSVFQLYQRAGLPLGNNTERDDDLYESYTTLFDIFLRNYREWLACKDKAGESRLMTEADAVMLEEAEQARQEAEDQAADDAWLERHGF
jgi:hypothetical protein